MKQIFWGRSQDSEGRPAAYYMSPVTIRRWTSNPDEGEHPWLVAGTFRNLKVRIANAPGFTGPNHNYWTYTVMKNGVETNLSVSILGWNLSGENTSDDITVADGDLITLRRIGFPSLDKLPPPTAPGDHWISIEFEGDNAGESGYGVHSATFSSGTQWDGIFNLEDVTISDDADAWRTLNVVPINGTLTKYAVKLASVAGSGNTLQWMIFKNGVAQDGTGGTPNTVTTIGGSSQIATSWTGTLALSAGDTVRMRMTPIAGTPQKRRQCGFRFVADTNGEYAVCGTDGTSMNNAATQYNNPGAGDILDGWTSTESDRENDGGKTAVTLDRLRVALNGPPNGGDSYMLSARLNGADPTGGPTVTVSDSATTGLDSSGTMNVSDTDVWSIKEVPSGAPFPWRRASWGFRAVAV
jgi:hypothetical protein